jgi:tRNA pseudouridine55 synthase
MLNGWIILDKPLGMGSTQGVGAVKRALREGGYPKVKIGHGGTLDPLATGVLPIALGEATKLAGRMLDSDKAYEFTVQFGSETDTLDLEGKVIATSEYRPGFGALETVLEQQFVGEIDQVPPAFSALKVDGERAYELARAGQSVELPSRRVRVGPWRYIEEGFVGDWDQSDQYATLGVTVSKGTYIRSLARDIAYTLNTVGTVTMLRRTKAGPFGLSHAISLDILFEKAKARALEDILLPIRTALDDIPALALTPEQARLIGNGRVLSGIAAADGLHLAMLDDIPVALVACLGGTMTVERGFNV